MSECYNIYGINWNELYEKIFQTQNDWIRQGLCPLCGGNRSRDKPLPARLKCPYCGKVGEYKVMPHCPGGVSHREEHVCPNCGRKVSLVVYYDGEVVIER